MNDMCDEEEWRRQESALSACHDRIASLEGRITLRTQDLERALARIAELEAIVGKLPKSADNKPIYPGMKCVIYFPRPDIGEEKSVVSDAIVHAISHVPGSDKILIEVGVCENFGGFVPADRIYSTPEAARQAKEQDHD